MENFKKIDLDSWDRLSVYNFFSGFEEQLFSIDFDIELPEDFVQKCKSKKLTPFIVTLYTFSLALNSIENFRYRLLNGEVVLFDQINPLWVEIDANKELVPVGCQFDQELEKFLTNLKNRKSMGVEYLKEDPGHFTASNNHWLDWTSVKHTRCTNNETNQKLVWGKIKNDKVRFSMELSHLFADGYHVSLFKKEVEESFKTLLSS